MEFDAFVTLAQILTFPGMITATLLLVQFTKRMADKVAPKVHTRYVVYFWAAVLCAVAAATQGDWSRPFETVFMAFVNSVIVWMTAMKTYETLVGTPPAA